MSDYISREAMSETPKCPGCGADMELMHLLFNDTFYYVCTKCGWDSPVGIDSESAFRMAMRRAEPKNRVLTLEEVKAHCEGGADAAPLWYETKKRNAMNRWIIVDVPEFACDITRTVKYLLSEESFIENYRKKHRFWLRKPTEAERRETPWEGGSHE